MCVLQVKVKYKDSNAAYSTFTMLDKCSEGYFVKLSFVRKRVIKTLLLLNKTLTGEETHISFAVDGLKVSKTSGLDAKWVSVPKDYTKDDLPVHSSQIAT